MIVATLVSTQHHGDSLVFKVKFESDDPRKEGDAPDFSCEKTYVKPTGFTLSELMVLAKQDQVEFEAQMSSFQEVKKVVGKPLDLSKVKLPKPDKP